MLQEIQGIEGLQPGAYEELDLSNDTNPGATIVEFYAKSEEMPALTCAPENTTGLPIFKTFIRQKIQINAGNLIIDRRINDRVELDPVSGKWKIIGNLKPDSHIKKYPNEWNAFMRGVSVASLGTPILLVLRHDPARADIYKFHGIHSLEQLSSLTSADFERLNMMGAQEDSVRAKDFLLKARTNAPIQALEAQLQEAKQEGITLRRQLSEAIQKFNDFIAKSEASSAPKRKGKKEEEAE